MSFQAKTTRRTPSLSHAFSTPVVRAALAPQCRAPFRAALVTALTLTTLA